MNIKKIKRQQPERIFASHISDKSYVSRLCQYINLYISDKQKPHLKNGTKICTDN